MRFTSSFSDKTEIYQVNINIISKAIKKALIKQNSRNPGIVSLAPSMKTIISNTPSITSEGATDSTERDTI